MENSVKTHIVVEGVILTPEAINTLKLNQDNNNAGFNVTLSSLSEVICFMAKEFQCFQTKEREQAALHISDLGIIRDELKSYLKP